MKTKSKELDVDFIGGQGPLTKEEEKAISAYLRAKKGKGEKKQLRRARVVARKKVNN